MVVYLYKKGRQTMKNIITAIAIVLVSLISNVSNAQTYTLTYDTVQTFELNMNHSIGENLDKNLVTYTGVFYGKVDTMYIDLNKRVMDLGTGKMYIVRYENNDNLIKIEYSKKYDGVYKTGYAFMGIKDNRRFLMSVSTDNNTGGIVYPNLLK